MGLAEDVMAERDWTEEKIAGLQQRTKRTHFTHFNGLDLKRAKRKKIKGRWHVYLFGKWRPIETLNSAPGAGGDIMGT